jgi:Family of unknown function (DUF5761)
MDFASANSPSSYKFGTAPNGRIDLLSELPELDIPDYQRTSVNNTNYASEATYGNILPNEVSRLFFSEQNIDALQTGIRYRVYVETNGRHTIGRQSDQELKIIMRSIYLQYSVNLPSNCLSQVRDLNEKVLNWAVPEVLSNLKQYDVYKQDASTMPIPMEYGSLQTMKGTRVLEIKKWM